MQTYKGTFEGREYSSLYPYLFRVNFTTFIGNRTFDKSTVESGYSKGEVFNKYQMRADVTGRVDVELVATLDPVAS